MDLFIELMFSDTYWLYWQYHTSHHYLQVDLYLELKLIFIGNKTNATFTAC